MSENLLAGEILIRPAGGADLEAVAHQAELRVGWQESMVLLPGRRQPGYPRCPDCSDPPDSCQIRSVPNSQKSHFCTVPPVPGSVKPTVASTASPGPGGAARAQRAEIELDHRLGPGSRPDVIGGFGVGPRVGVHVFGER